jgi:hypothetical protein
MSLGSNPGQPLTGIVPRHRPARPNESFRLWSGPVEVTQGATTATGHVEIRWHWFPLPEVAFSLEINPGLDFALEPCQVRFPFRGVQTVARVIGQELNVAAGVTQKRIRVFFDQPVLFDGGTPLTNSQIQIINFFNYFGQWIADPLALPGEVANTRSGRVILIGGGWKITLDAVSDIANIIKALKAESGFAITHVGNIEREDGGTFFDADIATLEEFLFDFLSFARGSWSAAVLPTYVNAAGTVLFERWAVPRLAPWRAKESWFSPMHAHELANLFPGFWNRWIDPRWTGAVRFAIHALVESNAEPISMEASLLLSQIALELLSAAILVEDAHVVTSTDFGKSNIWPAKRKFTELLGHCGIPTAIPPQLTHLTAAAAAKAWVDGPTALTQTRNKIAHSSLPNLVALSGVTADVKNDLRTLALWYVELVLLWWFGYQGGYRNRIDPLVNHFQEDLVPWAPPPPALPPP